jgi:glycosyltransferase involved in cell wall biosynthesis
VRIGINFQAKDEDFSGVEYYSLGLIRALVEHAPNNHYVIFTNQPLKVREYIHPHNGVDVRHAAYPRSRACGILWEHLVLPRLADSENLDVLHCPCYVCPILPGKTPYVATIHDVIALDHPEWCQRRNVAYYRLILKASARRAAGVIAVSVQTRDDIQRRLGIESRRIHVVYPGLDADFGARMNERGLARIRETYRLPERFFLHVGNIEPRKNLACLLRAYRLLQRQNWPHKLVLVGQRYWRTREFLEELSRADSSDEIVRTGYVPRKDLPGIYHLADLYVCTSLHEGFGFPPVEAMACGVPVISSNRGSLAETLGNAAYTIDPMDPFHVADAMERMLTDAKLREEYIERGLTRSRMFRWETAASQIQAVYAEAAGAKSTR